MRDIPEVQGKGNLTPVHWYYSLEMMLRRRKRARQDTKHLSRSGVLKLTVVIFEDGLLCYGGGPVHNSLFRSILGLYPLDVNDNLPSCGEKISAHC